MMDKVIKRFERHAQAYERRGFTNLLMGNLDEAIYDYTKSIGKSDKFPRSVLRAWHRPHPPGKLG